MNILALDTATRTGWASLIDGRIESGVQDFTKRRGESNGILFLRFNTWLDKIAYYIISSAGNWLSANEIRDLANTDRVKSIEAILPPVISKETRFKPFNLVVYEQAHHRGGAATEICVGLMTRAQEFATRIGAEYMAIHTASLKKYATGHGKASKEDMIAWASGKVNRFLTDDNEADAIGLLYFAMDEMGVVV